MSGDSHRRRENREREPLTKDPSYNRDPHILLLQAPTHKSSSLDFAQRLHFPMDFPPIPAPSPLPQLPYTGLPLPSPSQVQAGESMSIPNQLLTNFVLASNPASDPPSMDAQ